MMDRLLRGILFTLCGIATTVLTAVGLVYLELHYDCAIYGFVYAFVLPFGAMLSGLVAGSGYYFGSRLFSYRPGRASFVTMLLVSSANFFLIYWLKYTNLKVDGEPVRDWLTFAAYLKFTLTHTSMTMGYEGAAPGHGFELGVGGYVYAALLIMGFACGGYFVFNLVRSTAYCEACSLYMKKQGSQTRYFTRWEELTACSAGFKAEAVRGEFKKAVALHAAAGAREADATTGYSLGVEFRHCKKCGKQWLELVAKKRANGSWSRNYDVKYSAYCAEPIDAMEKLAGAS